MSGARLRALLPRLRSERGQTSAEYLGVVVFLVAVIAALFAFAPGIGETIAAKVREQVASIASPGEGSGAGGEQPAGTLPSGGSGGGGGAPTGAPATGGGGDDAGEEEPGLLEQGFDALGGAASSVAGGLGDLASGAGDLLSGAGDVLGGVLDGGAALLDGFARGDFGSPLENPWLESLRQIGQFASGVLIFGDVRDAASAIGEIISSGGRDGWGNLGLSVVGVVPIFGDAAKGIKGIDAIVGAFRAGDRARDGSRLANGARGADAPPARPRGPACSFTPSTPVLMADGRQKAIAEIALGERVIATDPKTGESGARAVERVIVGEGRKTLVRVRSSGEVLTATDNHPFWVESQRAWREAGALRAGDILREPGGEHAEVESVRVLAPRTERVHNLTVSGLHTYYAGKAPVLVHNQGCGEFVDKQAAFRHYAKHVKGVELGPNGAARPKPGGPDMPEFKSLGDYQAAAGRFLGDPSRGPGVLEKTRANGDVLRVDPNTGYFGVRQSDGTVRTFFRPDGNPIDYFNKQK